jgi:IPT/TIG domain
MKSHRFVKLTFGILLSLSLVDAISAHAQNSIPFVSVLFPQTLAPGGPSFILTVNGSGFVSSSVVAWNGSGLVTTYVNSTQVKATVPAADIASPGTAWVTVSSGGKRNGVYTVAAPGNSKWEFRLSPVTTPVHRGKCVCLP